MFEIDVGSTRPAGSRSLRALRGGIVFQTALHSHETITEKITQPAVDESEAFELFHLCLSFSAVFHSSDDADV